MSYIFMMVLVPKFLQTRKYLLFILTAVLTFIICLAVSLIPGFLIHFNYPYPPKTEEGMRGLFFMASYDRLIRKGACLIGLVITIKLAKGWYLQQIENNRLARSEAGTRTRLFKSYLQPGFLFDSLESLHKKIDQQDDEAPEMIIRFADILSYILYDCNEGYVALKNELKNIGYLIVIANMNRKNEAQIALTIRGHVMEQYTTPLALFSMIRNHLHRMDPEAPITIDIEILDANVQVMMRSPGLNERDLTIRDRIELLSVASIEIDPDQPIPII